VRRKPEAGYAAASERRQLVNDSYTVGPSTVASPGSPTSGHGLRDKQLRTNRRAGLFSRNAQAVRKRAECRKRGFESVAPVLEPLLRRLSHFRRACAVRPPAPSRIQRIKDVEVGRKPSGVNGSNRSCRSERNRRPTRHPEAVDGRDP
jgi:hypothetical protein